MCTSQVMCLHAPMPPIKLLIKSRPAWYRISLCCFCGVSQEVGLVRPSCVIRPITSAILRCSCMIAICIQVRESPQCGRHVVVTVLRWLNSPADVCLLPAARRTADCSMAGVWSALMQATCPADLLDVSKPEVRALQDARDSVNAEVNRWARTPPRFGADGDHSPQLKAGRSERLGI